MLKPPMVIRNYQCNADNRNRTCTEHLANGSKPFPFSNLVYPRKVVVEGIEPSPYGHEPYELPLFYTTIKKICLKK